MIPGATCPACGSAHDYHPDPSGPNGQTWWVCECCGYMRDHTGRTVDPGRKPTPPPDQDDD